MPTVIEHRGKRFTLPAAKAIVAALFPIVQTGLALYSDQTLTPDELKQIGTMVLAAVLVWLVPAPGYAAPGETAVPKEKAAQAGHYSRQEDRDQDGVLDVEELQANDQTDRFRGLPPSEPSPPMRERTWEDDRP